MKEIWKEISNFPDYEVSNLGRVKSKKRIVTTKQNKKYSVKEKILKPQINNKTGYMQYTLIKNKKKITKLAHILVAETFLNKTNDNLEINHKDENKLNNRLDNLEYCTHKYNINYGTGNYRRRAAEINVKKTSRKRNCKTNHTSNRKTRKVIQYDLSGNFIKEWDNIFRARNELKLNKIWEVCNGKRNKCGNFIWRYKEED